MSHRKISHQAVHLLMQRACSVHSHHGHYQSHKLIRNSDIHSFLHCQTYCIRPIMDSVSHLHFILGRRTEVLLENSYAFLKAEAAHAAGAEKQIAEHRRRDCCWCRCWCSALTTVRLREGALREIKASIVQVEPWRSPCQRDTRAGCQQI